MKQLNKGVKGGKMKCSGYYKVCKNPATRQLTKYKGTKHGWYCDSCYQEGLNEEIEAMNA